MDIPYAGLFTFYWSLGYFLVRGSGIYIILNKRLLSPIQIYLILLAKADMRFLINFKSLLEIGFFSAKFMLKTVVF